MYPALIAALGATMVVSHLVLTHPPVRGAVVARVGEKGFPGVFSTVALLLYAPLCGIWWMHRHEGALLWAWRTPAVTHAAEAVALVGFALLVGGMAAPAKVGPDGDPQGMGLITRHPMNLGIALWAASHVVVNGWASDVAFFGTHLALGVLGAAHQDLRLPASRPAYAALVAKTTFVPFPRHPGAISGRAWAGMAGGVGIAVALRLAHAWFR